MEGDQQQPPPYMANQQVPGPAPRYERAASSLAVDTFKSGVDDFETWVDLFERAVYLATGARDQDTLYALYMQWLPLKLDLAAMNVLGQAVAVDWLPLKTELIRLLVDPQERYKWQSRLTTIKWDGKESFHSLAARVKRAVDKYDKEMPDEFKAREYFLRFRSAFKKPWRKVIDLGCRATERTLENAKDVALRYQLTMADEEDEGPEKESSKSVAFAGANLHADRATSIETSLAGIVTHMENMSVSMRNIEDRVSRLEDRVRTLESESRDDSSGSGSGGTWPGQYRQDHSNRGNRDNRHDETFDGHKSDRRENRHEGRRDDRRGDRRNGQRFGHREN